MQVVMLKPTGLFCTLNPDNKNRDAVDCPRCKNRPLRRFRQFPTSRCHFTMFLTDTED